MTLHFFRHGNYLTLVAETVEGPQALSFGQARLWFLDRLEGGSGGAYTIPFAVRLTGELDVAALEGALHDVVVRHESLRTLFPERVGVPRQEIVAPDAASVVLKIVGAADDAALPALLSSALSVRFDLSRDLPLRAVLYELPAGEDGAQQHVLLVLLHHIAGDGWSLGPLWRDLSRSYAARLSGSAAALSPLPVQYADYTLWQRQVLGDEEDAGSAIARQLTYWREALSGLPDQIELPGDRARPAVSSHRGGSVELELDAELHRGLLGLARGHGASLFMVLQAGLAALLSRLGAGSDIAIGSPIAGRTDSALEELVGFFVNTLVLRTDTSGHPSFGGLLERVRAGNLAAYSHQDLPFERLVEVLNPARSLSRHPLFQVMLAFAGEGPSELELAGLEARAEPVAAASAKFDLSVALSERRGRDGSALGIGGVLEYSSDLFDRGSVEVLGQRLVRLLAGAVAAPGRGIGELEILSGSERATILGLWNATSHAVDGGTLPALISAQAARTPEAVALVFADRRLSYAALEAQANRLAHHLRGLGVGPETVVGLCVERSPEMVIGLLGILKAGGAYLPLDPEYPRERLAFMLGDAGASVLVTQSGLLARLPQPLQDLQRQDLQRQDLQRQDLQRQDLQRQALPPRIVQLDADWPAIARQPVSAPATALDPRHPAYVIYTSGSTGNPKGVVVEHGGIPNLAAAQIDRFAITPEARILQFASLSFDAAVSEIATALTIGAALILPADERAGDALANLIEHQNVTHATLPPVLLPGLSEDISLPTLIVAGEACSAETVRRWSKNRRMINAYGPTETTVCATISDPLFDGLNFFHYLCGVTFINEGDRVDSTLLYSL